MAFFLCLEILNTDNEHSSSASDSSSEDFNEEDAITYYFNRGYRYDEIIQVLFKNHQHKISYRTLIRRLQQYGLQRRANQMSDRQFELAMRRIDDIISGPGSLGGYRTVWHTLELEGIRVPRLFVQLYVKERDPDGSEGRRKHRLKRREYRNRGPNAAWHMDGYDKLKPYGFPIHGAIDGFSRKVLWLKVTRSNNSPDNIASFFVDTVEDVNGCPIELITDLGTENGLAAAMQCFFRDNFDAHRYVPSPRNQRIESWWGQFSKQRALWWKNFFLDLETRNIYDGTSEIHKQALWYSFHQVLQNELDFIREHWNTHYIRRSRRDTIAGRPDVLFNLPESYGGEDNLKVRVSNEKLQYVKENMINEREEENEYTEYFEYVRQECGLHLPKYWQEGFTLFQTLIFHGESGS